METVTLALVEWRPLPTHCVELRGADPRWTGNPERGAIRAIQSLTRIDGDGFRHFRIALFREWKRLRTAADYRTLNIAIQRA